MPESPAVQLTDVTRTFGQVRALDAISLAIEDGTFFALLGPSGSGKTTCLRLIAGFDQPTSGSIQLHGVEAAGVPPYERDVNTVFQDYALFPHMTVGENVGYALMIKKVARPERERRVAELLDLVQLPGMAARRPAQLSGGQRQRVALARALIGRPRVLLLDEPLGALDLKLRQQMQTELKSIQRQVGITFIFVTHDQEEALTMSDQIAVFNHGRVEQVGAPAEIYERPKTAFVAGFVGVSNIVAEPLASQIAGRPGAFSIRPEKIALLPSDAAPAPEQCSVGGTVRDVVYLGVNTRYHVAIDGGTELIVVRQNTDGGASDALLARGRAVRLAWQRAQMQPIS